MSKRIVHRAPVRRRKIKRKIWLPLFFEWEFVRLYCTDCKSSYFTDNFYLQSEYVDEIKWPSEVLETMPKNIHRSNLCCECYDKRYAK